MSNRRGVDSILERQGAGVGAQVEGKDRGIWKFEWKCEKWSEDAVNFVQRKLEAEGVTHQESSLELVVPKLSWRESVAEKILQRPVVQPIVRPTLLPVSAGVTSEMLRKYVGEAEEVIDIPGNLLVNEGIQRLLDLAIAAVNNQTAGNAWNAGSSYIGVGDSSTAEAASQTELQAASNRFYKAMNATYPSRSAQTVSWQADFTSAEANWVWAEWSVSAGATTASGSGFTTGTINLNRKVQALGTKSTGTWTLTAQVTVS